MFKNENGRSMVEMLGVLAIIGVLSVGGIAGYTVAMNKYRANEIADAASKVAVMAEVASSGSATLSDIGIASGTVSGGCVKGITASASAKTIAFDNSSTCVNNAGAGQALCGMLSTCTGGKCIGDYKVTLCNS